MNVLFHGRDIVVEKSINTTFTRVSASFCTTAEGLVDDKAETVIDFKFWTS